MRDRNKNKRCFGVLCPNWKKGEVWPYGFYWVTFSKKEYVPSKHYWNPKMFLYFLMKDCEDKRCFVWHDHSSVMQASMIPPPASSGEELFSGACWYKCFTCWLPFYASCYWKASKLSQSGYAKNTQQVKTITHKAWYRTVESVEGTEIQWNLSSRPSWWDLLL